MAKPKVFISYSAKPCITGCARPDATGECPRIDGQRACRRAQAERAFVAGLAEHLRDTCDVLWDATALFAGDDWRQRLYREFAQADAALILLTESSLESVYVPLEAMVFMWRHLLDSSFDVIPVFFSPLDENTLKQPDSRFLGIGLEALQGIKNAQQNIAATYAAIAQRIAELKTPQPLDSIAALHRLAKLLDRLEPQLQSAAAQLDENFEWRPGMARPFQLAMAILQRDLRTSLKALGVIVSDLTRDELRMLLKLLAPRWVDLRAAEPIWRLGRSQARQKLLVLNGSWSLTPEHYVQRAWSHSWSEPRFIEVTAADDGSGDEFCRAILKVFRDDILRSQGTALDVSDEKARRVLAREYEDGRPLYVIVRHQEGVSSQALLNAQRALPVTILYVNPEATPGARPEELLLDPVLTEQIEEQAELDYLQARALLCP